MPDFDLSITICSWNTLEYTRACLMSLRERKDEAKFEVIVVDNASSDGSAEMVEREFPEVRLLRQTTNLGFTGGHNLALRERRAPHAFLLNTDTIVHHGAIRLMMEHVREHPEAGMVGPKLLNTDGTLQMSCRRFPTPAAALFRNTPLGRWFPHNRYTREYLMTDFTHDKPSEVDWVSGAALFASGPLIERIGVLDPEFFMYCEDVDWCYRAWKAGFKVVYLPQAVITHHIGRSTDHMPNKMIVRFHRSMMRYYMKNHVSGAWLPLRPFIALGAAGALCLRASVFLARNVRDELHRRKAR